MIEKGAFYMKKWEYKVITIATKMPVTTKQ